MSVSGNGTVPAGIALSPGRFGSGRASDGTIFSGSPARRRYTPGATSVTWGWIFSNDCAAARHGAPDNNAIVKSTEHDTH